MHTNIKLVAQVKGEVYFCSLCVSPKYYFFLLSLFYGHAKKFSGDAPQGHSIAGVFEGHSMVQTCKEIILEDCFQILIDSDFDCFAAYLRHKVL
jgi:hypothetical protein